MDNNKIKIKVGDKVIVKDWGLNHPTFIDAFDTYKVPRNLCARYAYQKTMIHMNKDQTHYTVLYIIEEIDMALISERQISEVVYLIECRALKRVGNLNDFLTNSLKQFDLCVVHSNIDNSILCVVYNDGKGVTRIDKNLIDKAITDYDEGYINVSNRTLVEKICVPCLHVTVDMK